MYDFILKKWVQFRHCDEGVTLVEYGVAVGIAVGVGALVASGIVSDIGGALTAAGGAMP